MGKKKKRRKLNHQEANRKSAKEQGFYDGRFKNKVIPNKKKKKEKNYKIPEE